MIDPLNAATPDRDWLPRAVTGSDSVDELFLLLLQLLLDARDPDAYFEEVRALDAGVPPEERIAVEGPPLPEVARVLWNLTPLPWAGFRTRRVRKPASDAPCFCGSGRRYEHCCNVAVDALVPLQPEMAQMLLARALRGKDRRLALDKAPPLVRIGLAHEELLADRPGRAKRILTALLKRPMTDEALEADAIDLLRIVLQALGQDDVARKTFRALAASRSGMAASAAHRALATLALHGKDYATALTCAQQARAADPESIFAGVVEIQALLMLHRVAEADDCLGYWLEATRDHPDPDARRLFEAIDEHVNDLASELRDIMATEWREQWFPSLKAAMQEPLRDPLVREAGAVRDGRTVVVMTPDESIQAIEGALRDEDDAEVDWPAWLSANPLGIQSPEVLLRLLSEADALGLPEEVMTSLRHYRRRVHAHYLAAMPQNAVLDCEILEQQPLLIALFMEGRDAEANGFNVEAIAGYERLLTLEPTDRVGARRPLVNGLLQEEQDERALQWIRRYPNGPYPELAFGAVLALVRLNRIREAEAAFREAHAAFPAVLGYLQAERKQPPHGFDRRQVKVGGRDQAWVYREAMRDCFVAVPGLLPFMKEMAQRIKQGR